MGFVSTFDNRQATGVNTDEPAGATSTAGSWEPFNNNDADTFVRVSSGLSAASSGGSEGVSSHREGQRPQGLQEAAQDKDQRSGALHKDG